MHKILVLSLVWGLCVLLCNYQTRCTGATVLIAQSGPQWFAVLDYWILHIIIVFCQ